MRTLSVIFLCLGIWIAHGQNASATSPTLVGITFPLYDHPRPIIPGQGQVFVSYFITKGGVGWSGWIENGDAKSTHIRDTNAVQKATQCVRILKALAQPKDLPGSPNRILAARWFEGDKVVERKFPIDQVPAEVREVLLTMRCSKQDLKRLTFIQIPTTSSNPPSPPVTAALSNAVWICTRDRKNQDPMNRQLSTACAAALAGILNQYAKLPSPSVPQSEGPRRTLPASAPDLIIDVRSRDGKQLLAFIQGNRELGFIAFTVPANGDVYDPKAREFSIHNKEAIAKFYATVRKKR